MKKSPLLIRLLVLVLIFLASIGLYDFIMTTSINMQYFHQLGYGARQVAYFTNYPVILYIFWAIGVFASFIGSFLFLLRSRYTKHLFLAACISLLILSAITFGFMDRWSILGPKLSVQDVLIVCLFVAAYLYARYLERKAFLR